MHPSMKVLMPTLTLIAVCFSGSHRLAAQTASAIPDNVRASYNIDRMGDGIINEMIFGIPMPGPKLLGDTYIDGEWRKGKVLLYGQEKFVGVYPLRYDLDRQEMEVQHTGSIRVIPGNKVRSFVSVQADGSNAVFVNVKEYKFHESPAIDGFLRVVHDGTIGLLSAMVIEVKKPDYNEALNVGSRDYKVYKRENFYAMINGVLVALPSQRKAFISVFPAAKRALLESSIRANKTRLDREQDLVRLFAELNARP
jgi:hypothetical protein